MKDKLTESQTTAILKALDDALEQGPWDESNFLRVIGKNLREIRNNLTSQMSKNAGVSSADAKKINPIVRHGQQKIFIALYSSDGNQLQSWERIIANLPRQVISRPIYANEEDVTALIKTKTNKFNEAYVSLFIDPNAILVLSEDKAPYDKLGKPLLTLKDRSINLDNIERFVHLTGAYTYSKGRLIKMSESDS